MYMRAIIADVASELDISAPHWSPIEGNTVASGPGRDGKAGLNGPTGK